MGRWADEHRRSITDPEGFWRDAATALDWEVAPTRILDAGDGPSARWFSGARISTCVNAVDRHVDAGHGDRPAIIHDSPLTGTVTTLTYAQLRDRVARVAGVLRDLGVEAGDRVVIMMPMVPEAAIAMLACSRIGAVHSVVFGGFAAKELAARIDDARPVVLIAASCGLEPGGTVAYQPLVEGALELTSHSPDVVLVWDRPQHPWQAVVHRDRDWASLEGTAEPAEAVAIEATDPLYILYTSGTTARPKGVVRDAGGHAVALAWSMRAIYDCGPGDVFWAASDVGWVVGHSYIVYAPLLVGATTVIYEGKPVGTPDAGAFWRVCADHGVRVLFCAPTALRAIKREDPELALAGDHDLGTLAALFVAGERLDPDTWTWATERLAIPVVDHWWQTETGWPIVANPLGIEALPMRAGSPTVPVPGWDVVILDTDGAEVAPGVEGAPGAEGAIAIRLPLPPGALTTLWGDDERFAEAYLSTFPGFYATGDGGRIDAEAYLEVLGRTDDVINTAGHRLSSGAMEAVVAANPVVAECAVVGVRDELKGQVPVALVVLKAGVGALDVAALERELVAAVRADVGPVAAFKRIAVVDRLPKTRSGKVLRRTVRDLADGREVTVPPTIEDPTAIDIVADALRT